MTKLDRRSFIASASALGATLAWARPAAAKSRVNWTERRDLYPDGVASGDPDDRSVILWTRRPFDGGDRHVLIAEVALDPDFSGSSRRRARRCSPNPTGPAGCSPPG